MRVRAALAATLSLGLVAACSSGEKSPSASDSETVATAAETTTGIVTAPESPPSDPAASDQATNDAAGTDPVDTVPVDTGPAATEPSVPAGTTRVESLSLGVTFAVPETYTVLDAAELGDDFYEGAAFEELAQRTGQSIEEFERFLKEVVELYIFAPAAAEGFVDNVTVASVPTPGLPTSEQLEQTFEGFGAQKLTIDAGSERGLDYLQSVYEVPVGQLVVFGVDLHILVGGTPVEITASAGTRETADELGALILETVAPA